jgi:hypothetical protein
MNKCICDLKENQEILLDNGNWVDLFIKLKSNEYFIIAAADGDAMYEIEYCPKCGRKLK